MNAVRPAAVAGMFYPGDRAALAAEVEDLLGGVEELEPRLGHPKALIVPHAGYIYSGGVAAHAYDLLRPARGRVRRVVLLGPVHRVPVRGLAAPTAAFFETPLGRIPVDRDAIARAAPALPQLVASDAAHAMEHSLEVQLPFLQKVLGEFSLVPLAVGDAAVAEVAAALEALWGGAETVVVISTDLSHYHAYEAARSIDGSTLERIAGFATDLRHEEACGATPLNGFLFLARRKGLEVRRVAACNSGDTAGGRGRVVGYGSFALYEPPVPAAASAGGTLLALARAAIESRLAGAQPAPRDAPWLEQAGATFVTLTSGGRLRGCIGSLEPLRPLGVDVTENAAGAAFRDPRFPAVGAAEWPQCRVEVSLLGTPKPLRFADEDDLLEQIVAGEDGLILESQGRRGTFLPQVWESLPDKRAFLRELKRKAGIAEAARLAGCRLWRYRVLKWKE